MPPPKRPWFRLYTETIWDRKIRRLPVTYRWLWIAVLTCARQSPIPGVLLVSDKNSLLPEDIADAAAMPLKDVKKGLARLTADGLIEWDEDADAWSIPKWNERQFESDETTKRTSKHRSKEQRWNVPSTPDGTPQIQKQITELKTPPTPPQVGGTKPLRANGTNPRSVATRVQAEKLEAELRECETCGSASWTCTRCAHRRLQLEVLR